MKFFLLSVVFLFCLTQLYAQNPEQQSSSMEEPSIQIKTNRIYGKLLDQNTGKPIEAASAQLYIAAKDSLFDGMLTKANGDFNFTNLSATITYKLVVSALGFEPYEQLIPAASMNKSGRKDGKFERDLGNISLHPAIKQLEGITITGTEH